jgi:hypothetical protein
MSPHLQGPKITQARNQCENGWEAELVSYLAYFSTLKMEATCSSERTDYVAMYPRR